MIYAVADVGRDFLLLSFFLSSLAVLLASWVIFWINNIHSIVQKHKKIVSHAFIEGGNIRMV